MRKLAIAGAGIIMAMGISGAALAGVGEGLIGNTVTLSGPDGTIHLYYQDASSVVLKAGEEEVTGTWKESGNQICTQFGEQPENCTEVTQDSLAAGDSGTVSGENGEVQWSIAEGKAF